VQADEGALREWVEVLLRSLKGGEPHTDLPLDVRATAFQWRVCKPCARFSAAKLAPTPRSPPRLASPQRFVLCACVRHQSRRADCPLSPRGARGRAMAGYRWGLERKKGAV
jgi:AraC family transcriptional regulator of adaptative response/methylated-DNA-[protein]-cysteine methyltransferase